MFGSCSSRFLVWSFRQCIHQLGATPSAAHTAALGPAKSHLQPASFTSLWEVLLWAHNKCWAAFKDKNRSYFMKQCWSYLCKEEYKRQKAVYHMLLRLHQSSNVLIDTFPNVKGSLIILAAFSLNMHSVQLFVIQFNKLYWHCQSTRGRQTPKDHAEIWTPRENSSHIRQTIIISSISEWEHIP